MDYNDIYAQLQIFIALVSIAVLASNTHNAQEIPYKDTVNSLYLLGYSQKMF